jgi:hypothetical protein
MTSPAPYVPEPWTSYPVHPRAVDTGVCMSRDEGHRRLAEWEQIRPGVRNPRRPVVVCCGRADCRSCGAFHRSSR